MWLSEEGAQGALPVHVFPRHGYSTTVTELRTNWWYVEVEVKHVIPTGSSEVLQTPDATKFKPSNT